MFMSYPSIEDMRRELQEDQERAALGLAPRPDYCEVIRRGTSLQLLAEFFGYDNWKQVGKDESLFTTERSRQQNNESPAEVLKRLREIDHFNPETQKEARIAAVTKFREYQAENSIKPRLD